MKGCMVNISETRLQIWTYRELMGTLDNKKRRLVKKALNTKQEKGVLDPLEQIIWSAMTLYENRREQRRYLKQELKALEKRIAP